MTQTVTIELSKLELVLEALERVTYHGVDAKIEAVKAITAIKEALARGEQEPVAVKHMMEWVDYLKRKSDYGQHLQISSEMSAGACWDLARELEQFINTTPPQRKPLSLHELSKIFASIPSIPFDGDWQLELVRAIEVAHNIKE